MIDQSYTVEVHQALTTEQLRQLARYAGAAPVVAPGERAFTFADMGDQALSVWAYVCEKNLRATLVTETRIANYVAPFEDTATGGTRCRP
jgi:hypothetical protein